MTLMLVLLVLLPWSIWRQMHEHEVTREGLFKLPIIFAAIGVFGFGTGAIPTDAAALGYLAFSLALSIGFGIWRGVEIRSGATPTATSSARATARRSPCGAC